MIFDLPTASFDTTTDDNSRLTRPSGQVVTRPITRNRSQSDQETP